MEEEDGGRSQTSSSRRAMKRVAQLTPPLTEQEKKEPGGSVKAKSDSAKVAGAGEVAKTSKIASTFEKQTENNHSGTSLNRNRRNSSGTEQKSPAPPLAPVLLKTFLV